MDLEKRLSKAKTSLILDHPFVGSVALNMPMTLMSEEFADRLRASGRAPTACTDGKSVKYYPGFIKDMSDAELLFLVAHECMHPMLEHNYRRGERDPVNWNKAADFVINQLLHDEGIGTFIPGGCLDKNIYTKSGGTSEGIYSLLQEDDADGSGGSGGDIGGPGQDLIDATGSPAEQEQEAAEWRITVAQAAQAAKMAGKLSANMARLVDEVLSPKVDWRDVLQRFIEKAKSDQRSFARPNRRFLSQGMYLPSPTGEVMGELVFAVDMSGSISSHEANQFAAECKMVFEDCHPSRMHMVFFSHEVCAHDVIERDGDFDFNPRGGGGTAFSPVFEHIEQEAIEPAAVIFLTDLCCDDFGTPPECPVLWVSTERDEAPFGEVVMM